MTNSGNGDDRHFGGDTEIDDTATESNMPGRATGPDQIVFGEPNSVELITDFDDGVDAIEFLIESFGVDDLAIIRARQDPSVGSARANIRLVAAAGVDADQLNFVTDR